MDIRFDIAPASLYCPMLLLEILGVLDHSPGADDFEIAEYLGKAPFEVAEALRQLRDMGLIQVCEGSSANRGECATDGDQSTKGDQ